FLGSRLFGGGLLWLLFACVFGLCLGRSLLGGRLLLFCRRLSLGFGLCRCLLFGLGGRAGLGGGLLASGGGLVVALFDDLKRDEVLDMMDHAAHGFVVGQQSAAAALVQAERRHRLAVAGLGADH